MHATSADVGQPDPRAPTDDRHDAAFRALAHPSRRRALDLVAERPRTVGELAAELGATQPATSQHLRVLREARLVRVSPDGVRRRYVADLTEMRDVASWFDRYWTSNLDRLRAAASARHEAGGEDPARSTSAAAKVVS